ncbi:hypothetical protein [Methylopila sp. Yamaguchi]|uniref:hypothetical protein n=1 Tax=Methylopila sp. Yamaguchi TaxID=1437817 RepID=UPI000CAADE9C|nr:hypothetical protein [Methylopila sp. Yamaguchi]GBD50226.1 hypothetical protein METY_3439 [Methylopila sp. Yamaguchi]
MTKIAHGLFAGLIAASFAVAPAAMAQSPNSAQSTNGQTYLNDQSQADQTRMDPGAPTGAAEAAPGGNITGAQSTNGRTFLQDQKAADETRLDRGAPSDQARSKDGKPLGPTNTRG